MAYVVYEPNRPQESAQPVHGSGAEVQDHDPGTSQPAQLRGSQLHSLRQQLPRQQSATTTKHSRDAGKRHVGHTVR